MNLRQILFSSLFLIPFFNQGQTLRCPPIDATGQGKQKIDLTIGAGPTLLYGDVHYQSNMGFGIVAKGDYKLYKGLYGGLEIQGGQLRVEGQRDNPTLSDWDPRFVTNRYWAGSLNVTVYPYRFFVNERDLFRKSRFEQFVLNGLYAGIGIGGILNNYTEIERRTSYEYNIDNEIVSVDIGEGAVNGQHDLLPLYDNANNPVLDPVTGEQVYEKEYLTRTKDRLMPILNIGVAVPLNKYTTRSKGYFSVVVNSQFNFSGGEDLDGYDPRTPNGQRAGSANDMYNFSYVGLKYSF